MPDFKKALAKSQLPPGSGRTVDIDGNAVAVFNVDGRFFALDSACPHRGGPLGDGDIAGQEVTCPWHAWTFDIPTGCGTHTQAQAKTYTVKVEGEDIWVAVN